MRAVRLPALVLALAAAGCSTTPAPREEPLYDGSPLAHWVRRLQDLDQATSFGAVHAVASFRGPAVPFLAVALESDRGFIRQNAACALYTIALDAPDTAGVVPLLFAALGSGDARVRWWAVGAIGEMRPSPPGAEGALRRMLEDPDEEVRESVRRNLAGLTGTPAPAR